MHIDGLVQERRNSSALAMELRLACTNPSIYASVNQSSIGSDKAKPLTEPMLDNS